MIQTEHLPLVQGLGRFLDDLDHPNALQLAFVRSPHAHAAVGRIDVSEARAMPGVRAVLTGHELKGRINPIRTRLEKIVRFPHLSDPGTGPGSQYFETDWWPMAVDVVRYVGEIVALVVADDRYLAEDAADRIDVDYDSIAAVASTQAAQAVDAPLLHPSLPSNLLYENRIGPVAREPSGRGVEQDYAQAFESAPVQVKVRCKHPRLSGLAMENSGVLARFTAQSGALEVWTSTQVPHLIRDALGACLDLKLDSIRVVAPDVGGAFGPKMHFFPEEALVAFTAIVLKATTKWVQDRVENLQASFHARDLSIDAELAADSEGRVIGLRAWLECDVGAYSAFPVTCSLEPQTIGGGLPGPYRWQHYGFVGRAYATNKFPAGAYRGVGFPVGPLVTETMMDALARKLGKDPVAVRQLNLLKSDELPYENLLGATYDSGDYHALLDLALVKADYTGWRTKQVNARGTERRIGIGISCFIEFTGMGAAVYRRRGIVHVPGFDSARIRLNRDGTLTATVSTPSQGQGQVTAFKRLLGSLLAIDEMSIEIALGDTANTPYGSGTFASRSVVSGGGALSEASNEFIGACETLAARLWQLDRSCVRYGGGAVESSEGGVHRMLTLEELGRASVARDGDPGLEAEARYSVPSAPVSCATHIAVVDVDVQTGAVQVLRFIVAEDCGPMLNPQAVDGQVRGAVAQGIGSALLEQHIYDEQAQLLSGTLQDYLVPSMSNIPDIEIFHLETPSPFTPGGHKGMGESGTIGAPAAIANAIADALDISPACFELPLTPERVLRLVDYSQSHLGRSEVTA